METDIDQQSYGVKEVNEEKEGFPIAKPVSDDNSLFYMWVLILELLCLAALVLVSYLGSEYLGGYGWDGSGRMFNWHPLLMVIGMIILYGNAAIIYRIFKTTPKFQVKLIHAALQLLAFVCVVVSLVAVFGFHNHNNIPNMYSLHSWIGIGTVVLFGCQYFVGFIGFLFPKFGDQNRAWYLHIHVFFGVAILAMAVLSCLSGLTEKMLFSFKSTYSKFPAPGIIANCLGMTITGISLTVGYILYNPKYKKQEQYESID